MDSANLRQQDQLAGSSPSFHGVANNHLWNQIFILNGENSESSTQALKMFHPGFNGVLSGSRGLIQTSPTLGYNISSSMNPDLGFNWPSSSENYTNHSNQELQFSKIKQELADSCPNYSGTISDPSLLEGLFLAASAGYIKNEQDLQDLNAKLLLKTSSDGQISRLHLSSGDVYTNSHQSSANFGGAATCSSSRWTGQDFSSVNMQALDLLDSAKLSGILSYPIQNNLPLFRERGCLDLNLQEQNHRPHISHQKMPSYINEAPEAKRCNSNSETKTFETPPKKPRYEHNSSFPPFKVRKEKLGDRITALQQLVAPFGKTDTASVLLEAIGYIKFLQDQVETLSVPYMNASDDSSSRTIHGASIRESCSDEEKKEKEEPGRDLRSRGLCLVPLSCTSHVTDDMGGGGWPPSNFGGGI